MAIRFVEDPRDAEIAALKARIAELEKRLLAVNAANAANTVSSAVNKPAVDRNAYMRDYMRRRRALKNKNSTPI